MVFSLRIVSCLGLWLLWVSAIPLHAQTFRSSWSDASWQLKTGAFACSLSQTIVGFGELRLAKKASGQEQLQLIAQGKERFSSGWIKVDAAPLAWQTTARSQNLAQLAVGDSGAIAVTGKPLELLLEQLRQGRQVIFSGKAQGSDEAVEVQALGAQSLRVSVQPRQFASTYDKYQSCRANIIPYTFAQISRLTIYYAKEAQELSATARTTLDRVARYAMADKSVLGVIVDAHSDARADEQASDTVSRQQAELVAQYLFSKGLPEDSVTTRWHGDKYPVASNATEKGRAQNRRITLRLENAGTRKAIEGKIAERKKKAAEAQAKADAEKANADKAGGNQDLTLKELERMVESQDLRSGKQPKSPPGANTKP